MTKDIGEGPPPLLWLHGSGLTADQWYLLNYHARQWLSAGGRPGQRDLAIEELRRHLIDKHAISAGPEHVATIYDIACRSLGVHHDPVEASSPAVPVRPPAGLPEQTAVGPGTADPQASQVAGGQQDGGEEQGW